MIISKFEQDIYDYCFTNRLKNGKHLNYFNFSVYKQGKYIEVNSEARDFFDDLMNIYKKHEKTLLFEVGSSYEDDEDQPGDSRIWTHFCFPDVVELRTCQAMFGTSYSQDWDLKYFIYFHSEPKVFEEFINSIIRKVIAHEDSMQEHPSSC